MESETGKQRTNTLSNDEVIVRKVRSEDLSGIYNLILDVIPDKLPSVNQFLRDGFEESAPWLHILLAERRGEVVGAAVYYRTYWSWTGRTLLLRTLCVRQSVRRRGIGSRLFLKLCQLALQDNAQLDWFCPESDTAAKGFFAQFKPNINHNLDGTYVMRISPHTINEAYSNEERINKEVSVRMARCEDMVQLDMMIHEISAFQELSDGPQLHHKDLVEDALTCPSPWFFALVAVWGGDVVGAVMGNRVYTSWSRGFYLQSLYIRPSARRRGIADRLIVEFGRVAEKDNAEYIDFNVAPENTPAEALYRRFRARREASFDGHDAYRLDRNSLKELVTQNYT